jgi:DNA-binding NarL/FixJ family response regulator
VDRIRVVIVDDSPQARDGLRSILGSQPDVEVAAVATGGLEAIALAEEIQPDLVLVDAQMPGMDGAEATQSIKRCCPLVKVLFMTVHDRHIDEGIAAGADRCLMKDCTRQELLRAVRELAAGTDPTG